MASLAAIFRMKFQKSDLMKIKGSQSIPFRLICKIMEGMIRMT
ncbi:hypothetical protein Cflav_PD5635 [Pedosphaera parvula Ellin514]|uniref:Uncharacterized protein n=1 Tax=Pedosphaera parvula (strain Ellin514) TaxID=320771 RepID=B9XAG5_PEDPL|nr:hypothetical protein Cflav_PD5635 [Pedosphaera parvula Ellin514]